MSTLKERKQIVDALLTDEVISTLLQDKTTKHNIIWATNDYANKGISFSFHDEITTELITGKNSKLIVPRVQKHDSLKAHRSKDKAEVFTPAWVCNNQNNQIDNAWFGKERRRFNTEHNESWETNYYPVSFSEESGKTWVDYVKDIRLEISCGEAPYLTSRYDTVTGKNIPVKNRIGLFDRKLRIIGENTESSQDWIKWAKEALKATYGFEWQGDSLFLARKNILSAVIEAYHDKFGKSINYNTVLIMADIIAWNIWQMDGIKFVKPDSCHDEEYEAMNLFGEVDRENVHCQGCIKNDNYNHNGIYATIMDWEKRKEIRFIDVMRGGRN